MFGETSMVKKPQRGPKGSVSGTISYNHDADLYGERTVGLIEGANDGRAVLAGRAGPLKKGGGK
jgi:hypothetical protein